MDGVAKAEVDFNKKLATVHMKKDAEAPLRRAAVAKALEKIGGYKVTTFGPQAKKTSDAPK